MATTRSDIRLEGRSIPMLFNYAYGPVDVIEVHLKQRRQTHYRNLAGEVTQVEGGHPGSYTWFRVEIPHGGCGPPLSYQLCNLYIFNGLSNENLEPELCHSLAPKITDFAFSLTHGSFMGFFVRAHVDVSRVEVVVVDDEDEEEEEEEEAMAEIMELLIRLNGGDVVRKMGASRSVIEKLKKERKVDGGGDGDELGTCMVCLEELSGVEELIKMWCSHLFHEFCICRWLEEKNSCPICRCEVDADDDDDDDDDD